MLQIPSAQERLHHKSASLKRSPLWFTLPALIPLVLALLFFDLLGRLNPRLGHQSKTLEIAASELNAVGIWLSVIPRDKQVIVSTDERQVFRLDPMNGDGQNELLAYLQQRVQRVAKAIAIQDRDFRSQTAVTLAIDEQLNYFHIKPILYVLAKAGLPRYGFEVRSRVGSQSVTQAH